MSIVIEPIYSGGIAQLSYLVGDDSEGIGAVIDPRPDCDVYLRLARKKSIAITAIFETHIHADFLSGSRELSHRLGGAPVYASEIGVGAYGFSTQPVHDGDSFGFGQITLTACHTPGHTPEHMSYLASQEGADEPFAVFSGDTLFVDSVGRPDLLGDGETERLASRLFHSLRDFYLKLNDGVIVYPGHGAGSACGPDIGDRMLTTIGYERAHNPYLKASDEDGFLDLVLSSAPAEPRHYRPMKKLNATGPKVFNGLPPVRPLAPADFASGMKTQNARVVDTRDMLAFGSAHVPGAFNIGAEALLSIWSGWLFRFDEPLFLVLEEDAMLEQVCRYLWRSGHTNLQGYLAGGMKAWIMDGRAAEKVDEIDIHRLKKRIDEIQILDVRSPEERAKGYIPTSQHLFLPEVESKALDLLDPNEPVATYCASGYRASIASSILKRLGFQSVHNVPGSFVAWKSAGLEVEAQREPATASS